MNTNMRNKSPLEGMRIALLAEYYASGGTRTYLKQLLDFYVACGVDVSLIGLASVPDNQVAEWLEQYGFDYTCYWTVVGRDSLSNADRHPSVWLPWRVLSERKAFGRFLRATNLDGLVVSTGTPGQFMGAAGATNRSIYVLHTYPHGRRQRLLGHWFMNKRTRAIAKLAAVSEFQKSEMIRLWRLDPQTQYISVIPNSAGPSLPLPRRTVRAPYTVITAAWLEPYKEPMEWLEVAGMVSKTLGHRSVRFVWLGEGSLLEDCQRMARELEESTSVVFAGHVDGVEKAYAEADAYLQMSSTENMSLSVIDALRHGLPAVCTRVGAIPEIEIDGVTGVMVDVHDTKAAADALVGLLLDPQKYQRMVKQAWYRYDAVFSQQIWLDRMLRLHSEVFNPSNGSAAGNRDGI